MSEWQGLTIPTLPNFTGFAPPEGDGTYGVAVQVEALGELEAREGNNLNVKAPAGSVFTRLVKRAGLDRSKFAIWNTVWSRPPQNWLEGAPWEGEAIASYQPFRERAYEMYRPRVILAMGNVALKSLTNYGGKGAGVSAVQGYVLDSPWPGTWVIGTFHPSAIMQGLQGLSGVFICALQRALEIAREGFVREPVEFITHPGLDEMLAFERGFNADVHRLDFDIETPESATLSEEDLAEDEEDEHGKRDISFTIIRASLCYEGTRAISFPWQPPYAEVARRLLGKAKRLGVWNKRFDYPRLKADGVCFTGRIYDYMELWKHLQPGLPTKLKCRSLEFVTPFYGWSLEPWKMMNHSQPEWYSAADAYALKRNGDGIERDMRAKGVWELYDRHVTTLMADVLEPMAANGLPYSQEQAATFKTELEAKWDERDKELQARVPECLKPSKQKSGYKKLPKEVTGLSLRKFKVLGQDMTPLEKGTVDVIETPIMGAHSFVPRVYHDHEIYEVSRWCLLEPFLPTSPQQVKELIKHYGHKVGTARKTKKETSDDDTIKKLIRKCRGSKKPKDQELAHLLTLVRECRQLSKVLGTYVEGWRPGADGRIHSTPGFWGRMYRISWRRPNISATIQDKQEEYIAAGFRKCVAARPGHVLVEADWKGMEGVLVGYFADDPDYMRLAKIGVHDYVCSHILADKGKISTNDIPDLSLPDSELKRIFKAQKARFPKDRDDAKHVVHGCLTGDHQVLTENGWVRFDEYDFKTPIAQWDAHSKAITFARPLDYVVQPWHDTIIEARGRAISFNATPDHAFPARKGKSTYERVAAESLDKSHRLPIAGYYNFPGTTECDVRLAAAIQADSSVHGHHATFHLVKPRKLDRLRQMLTDRGIDYSDVPCKCHPTGRRIRFRVPDIPILTAKIFNENVLKLSKEHAIALLDEVCHWDGMKHSKYNVYMSTEYTNCMWIQTLAHLLGREALLRHISKRVNSYGTKPLYHVRFNCRTEVRVSCLDVFKYPYRGRVFCITTDTGYFMARKDGRIFVSGNTNYGMGAKLMAEMYEMTMKDAQKLLELYFALFPKIKRWQTQTLDRASKEARLTNAFGYTMPTWEVFRWDSRRQQWVLGEDAKSAIAFMPRDTGAAMLKEALLRLEQQHRLASEGVMLACAHDAILTEPREADVERVARLLKQEMERPVPELGGLFIPVDLKWGSAWHEHLMEPLELPQEVLA